MTAIAHQKPFQRQPALCDRVASCLRSPAKVAIAHVIDQPDTQKPNTTIDVGLLTFKAINKSYSRSHIQDGDESASRLRIGDPAIALS